jgi:hypothetical protein
MAILCLKIQHYKDRGRDTSALEIEGRACASAFENIRFPLPCGPQTEALDDLLGKLRDQHRLLWKAEDDIRALLGKITSRCAELADLWEAVDVSRTISETNDHRAQLVGQIDALFGLTPEEKVYAR